jgi:hypothetical protein
MKKIGMIFLICFSAAFAQAEDIVLAKKDYIALIVGNYVHGFKDFDTDVTGFNDSVRVGIYYDLSTQSEVRANQLAKRFRSNIPNKLSTYEWAKGVEVIVNVYSEDLTGRGY